MIVRPASAGMQACAMTLAEHLAVAAQLAEAFGNDDFASLAPRDEMLFVIAWHDAGWADLDRAPPGDPLTSLPCSLGSHSLPELLAVATRSIAFNEAHHPFCGLLVSMHQAGLYNGRHGLNSVHAMRARRGPVAPEVKAFLAHEARRQAGLLSMLRADPGWHAACTDTAIFTHYLQLQFFDRLALYLNLGCPGAPGPVTLDRVPASATETVDITLRPGINGITLAPFPFQHDTAIICHGRLIEPEPGIADWSERLTTAPVDTRRYQLRRPNHET